MKKEFRVHQHGLETVFVGEYGSMYSSCFSRNSFYEQGFLDYVRSQRIEGVYLDVGANIGNHSVYFSQHCPSSIVYAFEPLDRYSKYILRNIKANDLDNVILCPFALGCNSSHQIVKVKAGEFEVESRNLDELTAEIPGRIALIKIDVEGMETEVLIGGMTRIQMDQPRIFVEANSVEDLERLERILSSIGYQRTNKIWNASPTYEFIME